MNHPDYSVFGGDFSHFFLHLPVSKNLLSRSTFAAWDLGDVVSGLLEVQVTPGGPAQNSTPVSPHARDDSSTPAGFSASHMYCSPFVALVFATPQLNKDRRIQSNLM